MSTSAPRLHAAASSIANGNPSSLAQMRATVARLSSVRRGAHYTEEGCPVVGIPLGFGTMVFASG
jgi:hypothetical protein